MTRSIATCVYLALFVWGGFSMAVRGRQPNTWDDEEYRTCGVLFGLVALFLLIWNWP